MTLNHEEFIIECLDSISRQLTTYDFEVCLSDDNSSDNTYEVALEYLEKSALNYSVKVYSNTSRVYDVGGCGSNCKRTGN